MSSVPSLVVLLVIGGAYAQCPTKYVSLGGKCLLFLPVVEQSFEEAIYTCMYYGGKLAKIDDCNDFGEVANFLESNADRKADFWIDATDVIEEGNFIWGDGTPVQMGVPFWGGDLMSSSGLEPNGGADSNCVILYSLDIGTISMMWDVHH